MLFSGGDRSFMCTHTRPKSYFIVLAVADEVLGRMAIQDDVMPVIFHNMTDSYYKALLNIRKAADFRKLFACLDDAADVGALKDSVFKDIMVEAGVDVVQDAQAGEGAEEIVPLLDEAPAVPDAQGMLATAGSVARGTPRICQACDAVRAFARMRG